MLYSTDKIFFALGFFSSADCTVCMSSEVDKKGINRKARTGFPKMDCDKAPLLYYTSDPPESKQSRTDQQKIPSSPNSN